MLFECLSKQTSRDFELICVDDIVDRDRHDSASDYALRKGIPLVAMVSSKEKVRGKRFGQCNAINSGDPPVSPDPFPSRELRFWPRRHLCMAG